MRKSLSIVFRGVVSVPISGGVQAMIEGTETDSNCVCLSCQGRPIGVQVPFVQTLYRRCVQRDCVPNSVRSIRPVAGRGPCIAPIVIQSMCEVPLSGEDPCSQRENDTMGGVKDSAATQFCGTRQHWSQDNPRATRQLERQPRLSFSGRTIRQAYLHVSLGACWPLRPHKQRYAGRNPKMRPHHLRALSSD
jgi:hypothetical protein